jgi:hypothetical protein
MFPGERSALGHVDPIGVTNFADDTRRDTRRNNARVQIASDNRPGPDDGVVADRDIREPRGQVLQ